MNTYEQLSTEDLERRLSYAGFVLLSHELLKSLIVAPTKAFFHNTTFGEGMPWSSYEVDVRSRHKNEYQSCLLYLRDSMEAIDDDDYKAIQELRTHRNEIAHETMSKLPSIDFGESLALFERVNRALFNLSNYELRMNFSADPKFADKVGDWFAIEGQEYRIYKDVVTRIVALGLSLDRSDIGK